MARKYQYHHTYLCPRCRRALDTRRAGDDNNGIIWFCSTRQCVFEATTATGWAPENALVEAPCWERYMKSLS